MEGETQETGNMDPSQFDWKNYWGKTIKPFQSFRLGEKGWQSIAEFSSKSCFRLLKNTEKINTILELGGGSGCLSKILSKKLGLKDKSLTLIDNNPEAKKAWEKLSGFGNYIQGDFFSQNFDEQKSDLVFSDGLIEHWVDKEDRRRVIKRHAELSTKYVMIRVPKEGVGIRLLGMKGEVGKDGSYEKHYTPEELKQEISDAGLKVLGLDEDPFTAVVLAEII